MDWTRGDDGVNALSDEQLVARCQAGDTEAFGRLAERWETALFQFVRRTVGNPDEAKDLCQDALTKAYQNIGRLRDGSKFKAWLYHIAQNLYRDRFRTLKGRADLRSLDDVGADELSAGGLRQETAPDVAATRANLADLLGSALDVLPIDQRTAIVLREYHGFNSEEIGEITGVPATTVRTRIFYGLKSLRRSFGERGLTPDLLEGDL